MAQHKESSLNVFLSSAPTIKELTEHVDVGTNWYIVGTMLDLDQRQLQDINGKAVPSTHKMIEMFNLWLTTTPTASRRQILEVLRIRVVGKNTLADEYEKHLRKLHGATYTPPSTEAISILQRSIQSLNEALVSPVQVSQLLYCKRCISEATLDEMERIDQRRSLDDKKTTLLTAMQETVSSDYRKLKDIATVLSDVEETRDIANGIMTKYEEKFSHDDNSTVLQPKEVATGSNEDRASDILRNNYSALSQSITEPVRMARLLHEEVISDEALSYIISTRGSVSDSRAILLKAVRDAVHSNYKHLELFVTVLRRFSKTAHCGDTIFEDFKHNFNTNVDDIEEMETYLAEKGISSSDSETEDSAVLGHKISFPRNMRNEFKQMRTKFGSTFYNIRQIFSKKLAKSSKVVNKMKALLSDCFPDLKSELSVAKTVDGVLDVVKRKCSIVDVHPLEVLAIQFKVKEAEDIIKEHKETAKEFCKSVTVSLSKDETLQSILTRYLLCETITFVLNWDPDKTTLQDVNDVLLELELIQKYEIKVVRTHSGRSVVVNCYCPAVYTGSLIIAVLDKIKILQKRGLKEFLVGNCIIWDATQVVSENTSEMKDLLVQIDDLKAALKERDEKIMDLATFKELSENRLEEIEALQISLDESQYVNVQNEEVINEMKEKISTLNRELNQLLEDFEKKLTSWKDLSEKRLQEIEQLKLKLDIQEDGENGEVQWSNDDVHLLKPSVDQCMEVICELEEEHEVVTLISSSSESIQFLIPAILERRTVKMLNIFSSFLTHDDILSFSSQLSTNQSLTTLNLIDGSMSDDKVTLLAQSLQYNETLQYLNLQYNPLTSTSAQSLAELLLINNTLSSICLYNTNIDTDGVLVLMESLRTNNTLRTLGLDGQHRETCYTLPYYEHIKTRIIFS